MEGLRYIDSGYVLKGETTRFLMYWVRERQNDSKVFV